jgi:hypothetical protein
MYNVWNGSSVYLEMKKRNVTKALPACSAFVTAFANGQSLLYNLGGGLGKGARRTRVHLPLGATPAPAQQHPASNQLVAVMTPNAP